MNLLTECRFVLHFVNVLDFFHFLYLTELPYDIYNNHKVLFVTKSRVKQYKVVKYLVYFTVLAVGTYSMFSVNIIYIFDSNLVQNINVMKT